MEMKKSGCSLSLLLFEFTLGNVPVWNWSAGKYESSEGLPRNYAVGSSGTTLNHCEDSTNYSNFIHRFEYVYIVKDLVKDLTPVSRWDALTS